jgi:hypothetical protein
MAKLNDICACGCNFGTHCQTAPHVCRHDYLAWWPELVPVGYHVAFNHCRGFTPQREAR